MTKKERVPLFDTAEDKTLRIQSELADKIGLNESIILMQLEYLITISKTEVVNDKLWTYQSLEELRKFFPWWSIATISRIIKSLQSQGLISVDSFNKRRGDKTQWFALNFEAILKLDCVKLNNNHPIFHFEKCPKKTAETKGKRKDPIFQNGDTIFQNETPIFQNETTLPENTTKNTTEISNPNGVGGQLPPVRVGPKTRVKDKFLELTNLEMPTGKKDVGFWWGKFSEILGMARGDSDLACKWLTDTIAYMDKEELTIIGPQSVINLIRVLKSGKPLNSKQNGTGVYNGHQSNQSTVNGTSGTQPARTGGTITEAGKAKLARLSR